jgi:hypothetical protein
MKAVRLVFAAVLLAAIMTLEAPRLAAPSWAYDSTICSTTASQVAAWLRSLAQHANRLAGRGT